MNTQSGYPLSKQQSQLWRWQEAAGDAGRFYGVQCHLRIAGDLDLARLQQAVQAIGQRHEILRTCFTRPVGVRLPFQVVMAQATPRWWLVDCSTAAHPDLCLANLWQQLQSESFDLAHGVFWQIYLITLTSQDHRLFMRLPALCADTRTLANLHQELGRAYAAGAAAPFFAEAPLQYIDFADWQQEQATNSAAARHGEIAAWQQRLAAVPVTLPLPLTSAAPTPQVSASATVSLSVGSVRLAAVTQVAQAFQCQLAALLLAAWQTLLWRLGGQPALLPLAVTVEGRTYAEMAAGAGPYAQTLPQLAAIEATMPFQALLVKTEAAYQQLCQWQDAFTWDAFVPDSAQQARLCALGFAYHEWSPPVVSANLTMTCQEQYSQPVGSKLHLTCALGDAGLALSFTYAPAYWDAATIARMAEQYVWLLQSIGQEPETPLDQIALLPPAQRQQLLVEFNPTPTLTVSYPCIHQLFEAQVARTPDAVAVSSPKSADHFGRWTEELLTYGALNARANQLAHVLQQRGVQPGRCVALCVERSVELLVGLWGILKAGGAYLPLDPTLPSERCALLLTEAQAAITVTQHHLAERLPPATPTLCLDVDWPTIAQAPTSNPAIPMNAEQLAYVIFTSGSTGMPKGVAVEHRNLVNYVQAIQTALDLPPAASFATVSTLAADLGNTAIFPPLCNGGTLVVIPQTLARDPALFAAYCRQRPLDCLKITPSHLSALLSGPNPAQLLPRQRLVLGGEAATWELIANVRALAPDCRVFNHYGPTETTVGVLTYEVLPDAEQQGAATVPLGRPLAQNQVYLLDPYQQPVPLGAVGEIYIGGANVARGYLNQPALTAERFIANPFLPCPETRSHGARLYKTGDLARYLPNGAIVFLGRADQQVKVRGFRVELGEIEAVLSQHPAVAASAVVMHSDPAAQPPQPQPALVAYIVCAQPNAAKADDLQTQLGDHLRRYLPDYMLPAHIVLLDRLPLTPNGKVDRQALQSRSLPLAGGQSALDSQVAPPRTAVEEKMVGIWQALLPVERVGIHDNFFKLGGHSLLAVWLLAQIQATFGQTIAVNQVFEHPTVAGLAALLEQPQSAVADRVLVPLQTAGRRPPFFCVHDGSGATRNLHELGQALGPEQPVYGLQAIGLDGQQAPLTTIEAMATAYLAALQPIQPQGPYTLGGFSFGGLVAYEMARQLLQRGETVSQLVLLDSDPYRRSHQHQETEDEQESDWLVRASHHLSRAVGQLIQLEPHSLATLPLDQQMNAISQQLKTVGILPATADAQAVQGLLRVFKANRQLRYQPQTVLPIPALLLRPNGGVRSEPTLGWQAFFTQPLTVIDVPGDHFSMLVAPQVGVLAERLTAYWAQNQQARSNG